MMLDAFDQLRQNRQSFAIETTLSGRLYFRRAETMRQEGWKCGMIYVWLNSPSLAIERVAHRVAKGGHHVSHDDIRRRYARSQDNLIKYIEICDKVFVFDNSGNEPVYVGHGGNGVFVSDADHKLGQFIDNKLALET